MPIHLMPGARTIIVIIGYLRVYMYANHCIEIERVLVAVWTQESALSSEYDPLSPHRCFCSEESALAQARLTATDDQ